MVVSLNSGFPHQKIVERNSFPFVKYKTNRVLILLLSQLLHKVGDAEAGITPMTRSDVVEKSVDILRMAIDKFKALYKKVQTNSGSP